jgi:hypothetical protein
MTRRGNARTFLLIPAQSTNHTFGTGLFAAHFAHVWLKAPPRTS